MNFLTELKEGLSISWTAIRANKLRSALTTLGIVIGIVTVTLMGTAIEGLNHAFLKSISFIGADVLYVQRFHWFIHTHEEWMQMQKRRPITLNQVDALAKQLTLAGRLSHGRFPRTDTIQETAFRQRNRSRHDRAVYDHRQSHGCRGPVHVRLGSPGRPSYLCYRLPGRHQ